MGEGSVTIENRIKEVKESKYFLEVAKLEKNRIKLLKEPGFMEKVISLVESHFEEVVYPSLKALNLLAETPACRNYIKSNHALRLSVIKILRRYDVSSPAHKLASKLAGIFMVSKMNESCSESKTIPLNKSFQNSGISMFTTPHNYTSKFTGMRHSRSFAQVKLKRVIVKVPDIKDPDTKRLVEKALLSMKGLVSFSCDIGNERVTLHSRTELDIALIAKILLVQADVHGVELIIHDADGKEKAVPITVQFPEENLPDYMQDEDLSYLTDKALTLSDEVQRNNRSSWRSSISDFMSRTLFW